MIKYLEIILPSIVSIASIIWAIVSSNKASKETKENERLRTELNQKTHIKDSLFDYEFKSYIRLMGLSNSMLDSNLQLFPHISRPLIDKNEEYKRKVELYKNSIESRNKFVLALGETRPFIDENIYKLFSDFQANCMTQIILFEDFKLSERYLDNRKEEKEEFRNAFTNQDLLVDKYNEISLYIKNHLLSFYN